MSYVWSMLNILQLISFTTKFNLNLPDNVYLFFLVINDLISMKAKFLQDLMDDVLDSVFVLKRDKNGDETSIMKNLGFMLFALIAIVAAIILVFAAWGFVFYVKM